MCNYRNTISKITELFMLKDSLIKGITDDKKMIVTKCNFEVTDKAKQINERKWIK